MMSLSLMRMSNILKIVVDIFVNMQYNNSVERQRNLYKSYNYRKDEVYGKLY